MVVVGKFRNRAELRKHARRQFQYTARIFVDKETSPIKCTIVDVSASGAHVVLQKEQDLPDHFSLMFTESGSMRRNCRVVWHTGPNLGVAFVSKPPQQSSVK